MYAASRPNTWVLHGARALNSYMPLEFQTETQDFDWIVHESENLDDFVRFLNQKVLVVPEIITTTHLSTVSLSYFKTRVLDIMFVKSLPLPQEISLMEVPYSPTPNPLAPILLPIPQKFHVQVFSFQKIIFTLEACIHDLTDPGNEWRRIRDSKTMRKIVYCQSQGYIPKKARWIPESMLDFVLGVKHFKKRIVPCASVGTDTLDLGESESSSSSVASFSLSKKPTMSIETDTDDLELLFGDKKEFKDQETSTDVKQLKTVGVQTDAQPNLFLLAKNRLLKEMDGLVNQVSKPLLEKIKSLEEKFGRVKEKHRHLKTYYKQVYSACRYMYHGWKMDISTNKMYQQKLEKKFANYAKEMSMIKILLLSLLENRSMVFKEWSFMNWALFQESFLRHLEWFSNEGIPGMVETQIWINDVPAWWKDQVNLFPFVSSTISYAMFNFLQTNHKTTVDLDTFVAMKMSNDKTSITSLKLQNSYITKQMTQFMYDQCESKKFGWYISDLPENLSSVQQEYDNSKIKMESLVCLIVSSVLQHQVRNEQGDRAILVTLQRMVDRFFSSFSLEINSDAADLESGKGGGGDGGAWRPPRPYHRFRNQVADVDGTLDALIKKLPKEKRGFKIKGRHAKFFKKRK